MSYPEQVRIIAGKWRGRKISVPKIESVRPTPDRVRETLFNWLQGNLAGTRCLDLFAGTGVLGFEALSRGADFVSFAEQDEQVIQHLKKVKAQFAIANMEIVRTKLPPSSNPFQGPYDVVFLDPPYQAALIEPMCQWLNLQKLLNPGACVYIEASKTSSPPALPVGWEIVKAKTAGAVSFSLIKVEVNHGIL